MFAFCNYGIFMFKKLKSKIMRKWDFFIYRMAYRSIKRMMESDLGLAYLFKLYIDGWVKENPVPDNLKSATEYFYESLVQSDSKIKIVFGDDVKIKITDI